MTFFTIDEDEVPQDTRDVLAASAVLEITEFRLFELAYTRWFGEPASEKKVERYYEVYMFRAIAPFWVRQFCREVMDQARLDRLDPTQFGVFPLPESETMFQRGIRYSMVVAFVMLILHLVAIIVAGYGSA